MTLRLYNTLTKQKEVLEDLPGFDRNNVRMYVCGPTVYDFAHIGNARPVIVFDVLFRLLRHLYGPEHVTYVRNITDVDDKIMARAAEEHTSIEELTERTTNQFHEDIRALGVLMPEDVNLLGKPPRFFEPRATQYIPQMIAMIERLIASGHAYSAEDNVLYDVSSNPDYGKLARRSLDEMIAGARVEVAPYKKNPMDFVLWKPSTPEQPGWDSPWGRGRPGWHIECSAMSEALLGETFDIHGGGIDLVFPHHENEIAQSEGAHHGHPLARIWMHNGFLQVEGEKMSKSLGNFVTIDELLHSMKFGGRLWEGSTLRFAMLQTHYRQPIDWTIRGLEQANHTLENWKSVIDQHTAYENPQRPQSNAVLDSLRDDLNTPLLIAELHRLAEHGRKGDFGAAQDLYNAGMLLGFDWRSIESAKSEAELRAVAGKFRDDRDDIEVLIENRKAARKAKNFKEADRIRDELLAKGIVLKDGPTGTTWEVKR
jgi:cysteinyl-tRNA synthetase